MNAQPLAHLKIASPCSAAWEQMEGDNRVRFCTQCERNVYNLSGLTQIEAKGLINQTEGRLCVRFYQRKDGTVLTADCPVGLKALKQKVARVAQWALLIILGIGSWMAKDFPFRDFAEAIMHKVTEAYAPAPPPLTGILVPQEHAQFQTERSGNAGTTNQQPPAK